MRSIGLFLVTLAFVTAARPVVAEELSLGKISLNGFGAWYFAKTDNENLFLGAEPDGSYRTASVHLAVAADVSEKLRVVTQFGWRDSAAGSESVFDYLFAEWRFNDQLRARVGKSKIPFGIYGEVPFVGTLRPFLVLPQAAYGPVGFLGESYKGVGLTGRLEGRFKAQWDLYGGGTELLEDVVAEDFLLGTPAKPGEEIEHETTRNVLGGHIVLETPVNGLSVGGSVLTGDEVGQVSRRRNVFGVQAEYTDSRLTVRSEAMREKVANDLDSAASYLEASYRLTDHWQVAAEAGRMRVDFAGVHPTGLAANLRSHDEVTVGLNYWLSSNLVIKLDSMWIRGNAFSHPSAAELPDIMAAAALHTRTHLLLVGAEFSF